MRDDIHGEPRSPQSINAYLLRVGGKNPFGEPGYRLVHTSNRYTKQGGKWNIWADNLNIQERGGMMTTEAGLLVPSMHAPDRVEICVKEVLKYPSDLHGWILERWMPASFYGMRSDWEGLHLPGRPDIPFLGPYPVEGEYESCSGISAEIPSLTKLQEAIQFQVHCDNNRLQGDLDDIVKQRVYEAVAQYEEAQRQAEEENEYRIREFLSPWKSSSLEASRWRCRAAEKAGVKEHAGT